MTDSLRATIAALSIQSPVLLVVLLALVRSTVLVSVIALADAALGARIGSRGRRTLWACATWGLAAVGTSAVYACVTSPFTGLRWTSEETLLVSTAPAVLLWGVPALTLALLMARSRRIVHGLVEDARPLEDDGWLAEVRASSKTMGRSPPRLLTTPSLDTPVAVGLLRTSILIPAAMVDTPGPVRGAVVRHELEHLRALDVWTRHAGLAARALLWFSPAAWYAVRRARLACEHACDAVAVKGPVSVAAYARYLTRLAWMPEERAVPAVGASMGGHDLVSRLEALSALAQESRLPTPPPKWVPWVLALTVVGASFFIRVPQPSVAFFPGGSIELLETPGFDVWQSEAGDPPESTGDGPG